MTFYGLKLLGLIPRKNWVLGLGIGLGIIPKPRPKTQTFLYPNPKPKPKTQKFFGYKRLLGLS